MAARIIRKGVRVQEIVQIEVDAEDEQELQRDPAGYVRKILEEQGHQVNEVVGQGQEIMEAVLNPAE